MKNVTARGPFGRMEASLVARLNGIRTVTIFPRDEGWRIRVRLYDTADRKSVSERFYTKSQIRHERTFRTLDGAHKEIRFWWAGPVIVMAQPPSDDADAPA